VEFLVIAIFYETKIPTVDMKVHMYFKFSKNKIWKKLHLQVPWGMEDFTLPSVGASFKKWGCYAPILPKCQAHLQTTPKKTLKKPKKGKKGANP
jgi:hypothetical protein